MSPLPVPASIIPVYGHERLQLRFKDAIARGTLPASLLLQGPRGVGKQRLALWLGSVLLCTGPEPRPCGKCEQCRFAAPLTHPDLHWFFPRPRLKDSDPSPADVREDYGDAIAERVQAHGLYTPSSGAEGIYVAAVRTLVQSAAMAPAIAKRKVFVIGDAERMVPQEGADAAANAFLKLLEEPPADTTLILTSSEPGALLPTIRSRVVSVRVPLLSDAALREFVSDERVVERLRRDGVKGSYEELSQAAAGAPGRLLDFDSWLSASSQAKRLLEAAISKDRAIPYQVSLAQGSAGARGRFSDTLDALTDLLHDRARSALARHDEAGALGATRAVTVVERAKEHASGNVSPQLVSSALLRELGGLLR